VPANSLNPEPTQSIRTYDFFEIHFIITLISRSQWPRGLRRYPIAIVGSNPTGGMDVCRLCVFCVVR
jgi:hypothetical protein